MGGNMQRIKHIGPVLRVIHTAIDQHLSNRAQEMELTSAQLFVLHYIIRNDDSDVYQKDIEARLELSHATVSGLIARLESKGFLECVPGTADKRYKRLCATEKARCCEAQMHMNIEQTEQLLLNGMTEEEIEQFKSYLDRILCNLGIDIAEERQKRGKENA